MTTGWSGRLDSNQRPPHPQCDALPGCATPRPSCRFGRSGEPGHLVQAGQAKARSQREAEWRGEGESRSRGRWPRAHRAGARRDPGALPARRADRLADPGQPRLERAGARASPSISPTTASTPTSSCRPRRRGSTGGRCCRSAISPPPDPTPRWVAFGAGERRVYLDTPRWRDIKPRTIWPALTGGERVMHVEWVARPGLRRPRNPPPPRGISPAVGRRSAPTSSSTRDGRPMRIDHPGYGRADAFYRATGKANAIQHLQQLGRRPPAPRRGQDQPVVALRPGADVAVSARPIRARSG